MVFLLPDKRNHYIDLNQKAQNVLIESDTTRNKFKKLRVMAVLKIDTQESIRMIRIPFVKQIAWPINVAWRPGMNII